MGGLARPSKRTKPTSVALRATRSVAAAYGHKNTVLTLVKRGGSARSFHIDGIPLPKSPRSSATTSPESELMTDEFAAYHESVQSSCHDTVNHAKEYVRYWNEVTNKTG